MSIGLQKQIRQNAQEVQNYLTDLYKWEKQVNSGSKTAGQAKTDPQTQKKAETPVRNENVMENEQVKEKEDFKVDKALLKKGPNKIGDYYKAWDQVDVEEEVKKLSEEKPKNIIEEAFRTNPGESKEKGVELVVKGGNRRSISSKEQLKTEGNEAFKSREYKTAVEKYTACLVDER